MKHLIRHIILLCGLPLLLAGCMEWDYGDAVEDFNATGAGLFITNEGNFQYGNATLSYYDPETQQVQNESCLPSPPSRKTASLRKNPLPRKNNK